MCFTVCVCVSVCICGSLLGHVSVFCVWVVYDVEVMVRVVNCEVPGFQTFAYQGLQLDDVF